MPQNATRRLALFVAALSLAALAAGCSRSANPAPGRTGSAQSPSAETAAPRAGETSTLPLPAESELTQIPDQEGRTVTAAARWTEDGVLHVIGEAPVPDVHLEVWDEQTNQVIAQADAQVKDGRYEANLELPNGPVPSLSLYLKDTAGGQLSIVALLDPATGGTSEGTGNQVSLRAEWRDGNLLHISGLARVPDLHFDLMENGQVIARADTQIKDGIVDANLLVEGGPRPGLELVVSNPDGGEALLSLPLR